MARSDSGGNSVNKYVRGKLNRQRANFRAIPVVHVYVARYPFPVEDDKIAPPMRRKEIDGCSNPKVREQKYYVWKLLESALMRSFGMKIDELNLRKTQSGKWECDACHFSLSHSEDIVAVAVSSKPVGVDIEKCDPSRFTDDFAVKIATQAERMEMSPLNEQGEALNALWTKKEAIFKMSGGNAFVPTDIETSRHATATKAVLCDDGKFFLTVASQDAAQAVFRALGGLRFNDIK